ncbi:MAG: glycosyltransferase family 39 protein [Gemmatimonadaceae bacterium]
MSSSRRSGAAARLALTVFLVYVAHFASNVVRETYLAITLGEHLSVRVDDYVGLHPDLFEIPGRGAYINNNPGASMLGAIPYALARPALAILFHARPDLIKPKPAAAYNDPRPNRTKFLNASRERGLDVKLGLAAAITQAGLMAPLGAIAVVVLFGFLRDRLGDERAAVWLSILYAFGTPIFFRSAFLNQNAIVTHCTLIAFVLLASATRSSGATDGSAWPSGNRALMGAGAMLGIALLCDYSAAALIVAFGFWTLGRGWHRNGFAGGLRDTGWLAAGAIGPLLLLLWYQWDAFGNPFLPAQHYMTATQYSGRGIDGISLPVGALLWGNLFDLRYGLFAFSPMLLAAVAAPFVERRNRVVSSAELTLIFVACAALWLFSSANQYAFLQWNTGVRYMVPAAPLLFIGLVPVLLRCGPVLRYLIVLPTVVISWSVAMVREDVPTSLMHVLIGGFELPFLTVLRKTASAGYAPFLVTAGVSPLPIFVLLAVTILFIWRRYEPDMEPR